MSAPALSLAGTSHLRRLPAVAAAVVLAAFALVAVLHNTLAPYRRGAVTDAVLVPPGHAHPFGTDLLGRDVFSETIHALAVSVGDALVALIVVLLAGTLAGLLCAHLFRGSGAVLRTALGAIGAGTDDPARHRPCGAGRLRRRGGRRRPCRRARAVRTHVRPHPRASFASRRRNSRALRASHPPTCCGAI